MRKQRGGLTIPMSCQAFFAFSETFFRAAEMRSTSLRKRVRLNFS